MSLAFISPSPIEMLIVVVAMVANLAWWIGVPYGIWLLLKRQKTTTNDRLSGDGVFTESIVGEDGILRTEMPLGPGWAGRPVRVVVEAIGRL